MTQDMCFSGRVLPTVLPTATMRDGAVQHLHSLLIRNVTGGTMKIQIILVFTALAMVACTHYQVTEVDSQTGYFPTSVKATVVKNEKYDLDPYRGMGLVTSGDFIKGQLENIRFFENVVNPGELETLIVKQGLQDKVPSVRDKIGINKAYSNYKPFLWVRGVIRGSGSNKMAQLIVTDPKCMEDIFVAERPYDPRWAGVSDQNTWYPLFNALIDYLKANSKTFMLG
jgi:hypothetical protein